MVSHASLFSFSTESRVKMSSMLIATSKFHCPVCECQLQLSSLEMAVTVVTLNCKLQCLQLDPIFMDDKSSAYQCCFVPCSHSATPDKSNLHIMPLTYHWAFATACQAECCTYDHEAIGRCFSSQGAASNFLNGLGLTYALGSTHNCMNASADAIPGEGPAHTDRQPLFCVMLTFVHDSTHPSAYLLAS